MLASVIVEGKGDHFLVEPVVSQQFWDKRVTMADTFIKVSPLRTVQVLLTNHTGSTRKLEQ